MQDHSVTNHANVSFAPQKGEISLVDLWVQVTCYKRMFISVVLIVTSVGLIAMKIYPEQYRYSTTIAVAKVIVDNQLQPIQSMHDVAEKVRGAIIPSVLRQFKQENPNDDHDYIFNAQRSGGKDILVIESKDEEKYGSIYLDLLQRIAAKIKESYKSDVELYRNKLLTQRKEAERILQELNVEESKISENKDKLDNIIEVIKEQIKSVNQDMVDAENRHQETIKNDANKAAVSAVNMYNQEIQGFRKKLLDLEGRLNKNIAEVQSELSSQKLINKNNLSRQKDKIKIIDEQLESASDTGILLPPVKTYEPIGFIKEVVLVVLILLLAVTIGVYSVIFAEIRDKAKSRINEKLKVKTL